MKATDLRIGNVVMLYGTETLIHPTDFKKWIKSSDNWEMSAFEPIPLTEEWLIKFGFKEYEKKYFIGINYGRYSVKRVGDVFNHWYLNHEFDAKKRIASNIMYVHQLQNLYHALTGKELTTQTTF